MEPIKKLSDNALTLELASFIGSSSLEDHYWVSGWQTAIVRLIAGLGHNESIIDIGCGVGRLAFGLRGWFGGRYVGIDIVPAFIAYCKREFPRFEFYCVDVRNKLYNPGGTIDPLKMVLPVENDSFDLAVLFSVYTHLLPDGLRHLASEVSRVLKPNGRCLASFFLLDDITPNARFSFGFEWTPYCSVETRDPPEAVVGYQKDFVVSTFAGVGLTLESFHSGSWTGRQGFDFQDDLVFRKTAS